MLFFFSKYSVIAEVMQMFAISEVHFSSHSHHKIVIIIYLFILTLRFAVWIPELWILKDKKSCIENNPMEHCCIKGPKY